MTHETQYEAEGSERALPGSKNRASALLSLPNSSR